jgi:hypothetical protein
MDIYSLIISKDVGDYCRELGHTFNSAETAAIIASSKRTLKEKHALYREILSDYPDMPVPAAYDTEARDSLHSWLREIIDYEEKSVSEFFTPGDDIVYFYSVHWDEDKKRTGGYFRTAEGAISDLRRDFKFEPLPDNGFTVHNELIIDAGSTPRDHFWHADFNVEGELTDISTTWADCPDSPDTLYFDIPVPFKRYDILEVAGEPDSVFMLDRLSRTNKKNTRDDMSGLGFYVGNDGRLYHYSPGYPDTFKYHTVDLNGKNRLLHHVRRFMTGKTNLETLSEKIAIKNKEKPRNMT